MRFKRKRTDRRQSNARIEGADLSRAMAQARRDLDALTRQIDVLARLCTDPQLRQDLVVEEGPFQGDAPAALETARIWLDRTRLMLNAPIGTMANAHIALGGLASKPLLKDSRPAAEPHSDGGTDIDSPDP